MFGVIYAAIIIGVPTVLFLALRASYRNYKETGKVETGVHYDLKNKKWAPGDPRDQLKLPPNIRNMKPPDAGPTPPGPPGG